LVAVGINIAKVTGSTDVVPRVAPRTTLYTLSAKKVFQSVGVTGCAGSRSIDTSTATYIAEEALISC